MSEGAKNTLLPKWIDPRKLAQMRAVYEGSVTPEKLPRLRAAVEFLDVLQARVEFGIDDNGKRCIKGELEATLSLICQRCMEPISIRVKAEPLLAVVASEEKAEELSKDYDPWIVPEVEADLHAMVEDEMLLALPIVAYHREPCVDSSLLASKDTENVPDESDNPFSVLAVLKGKAGKD